MRRRDVMVLLLLLAGRAALAQERGLVANMGTCSSRGPRLWIALDGASSTDCATGAGTSQVLCLCAGGSWAAITASEASPRPLSFDNAPASAHAYNCEFTGALCSGWSLDTTATAIDSGTVSPISTASGNPLVDYTTWPGWALFQSDESTTTAYGAKRASVTLDTNATIFAHVTATLRNMAANEGQSLIALTNSGDSNEVVYLGLMTNGSGNLVVSLIVNNNGTLTSTAMAWPSDLSAAGGSLYLALVKATNTYHGFVASGDLGQLSYLGSATKTGVTTLDCINYFTNTADDSPRIVTGVDFVRYYAGATLALANP